MKGKNEKILLTNAIELGSISALIVIPVITSIKNDLSNQNTSFQNYDSKNIDVEKLYSNLVENNNYTILSDLFGNTGTDSLSFNKSISTFQNSQISNEQKEIVINEMKKTAEYFSNIEINSTDDLIAYFRKFENSFSEELVDRYVKEFSKENKNSVNDLEVNKSYSTTRYRDSNYQVIKNFKIAKATFTTAAAVAGVAAAGLYVLSIFTGVISAIAASILTAASVILSTVAFGLGTVINSLEYKSEKSEDEAKLFVLSVVSSINYKLQPFKFLGQIASFISTGLSIIYSAIEMYEAITY
ncbi:hypothetical protein EI74_0302 [Mycoplasma testudineum]|uniref:Uncharacterized protein n=1 Tax=Mycoplasma testudineum TaxID=244584 RepID=A0A4R6IER2_9MOLU|nr:hypothetical protein [Mycoplasma testudineum]OYD26925.1 hypothetical protein CG473_01120 [Mycoplasma testudineum]TDO20474.1 hypothetical protein EI74_0302 [Mycoplasma testudineum]